MNRPSAAQRETARRLLLQEDGGGRSSAERAATAERVYETMVRSLAPLIGALGVGSIFARSVRLASADFPCLAAVTSAQGPADDPGAALRRCLQEQEPDAVAEIATAVFATFFALLTHFIGERLIMQIIGAAWPIFEETKK
jgi:hypothetical protein